MVELMVAVGLMGLVMVSMIGTFMVFASGTKGVSAYTEMSQQSRTALELLARDVRSAHDITEANEKSVTVVFPNDGFYAGGTAQYTYDSDFDIFSRIIRDGGGTIVTNEIILDGVENFTFGFFDPLGQALDVNAASLLLSAKSIQIDAAMVRSTSRVDATDYIISARFMMRNRPVTE